MSDPKHINTGVPMQDEVSDIANNGGPAFPVTGCVHPNGNAMVGMTLRDYFAGQVLTNIDVRIPIRDDDDIPSPRVIANYMYVIADAMLAAREEKS